MLAAFSLSFFVSIALCTHVGVLLCWRLLCVTNADGALSPNWYCHDLEYQSCSVCPCKALCEFLLEHFRYRLFFFCWWCWLQLIARLQTIELYRFLLWIWWFAHFIAIPEHECNFKRKLTSSNTRGAHLLATHEKRVRHSDEKWRERIWSKYRKHIFPEYHVPQYISRLSLAYFFFVLPCLSFLLCSGETCLDFLIHKNEICNAHYYKQATALPCALIWNMVIQLWRKETREKKHRNFHTNAARFSNVMYYCYFYCCCCYYWCCCCRWYRVV